MTQTAPATASQSASRPLRDVAAFCGTFVIGGGGKLDDTIGGATAMVNGLEQVGQATCWPMALESMAMCWPQLGQLILMSIK
jgi:hypothetical protein